MALDNSEQLFDIVGIEVISTSQEPTALMSTIASLLITACLLWFIYRYKFSDKNHLARLIKQLKTGDISVKAAANEAYTLGSVKHYCSQNLTAYQQFQAFRFAKDPADIKQLIVLLNSVSANHE